MKQRHPLVMQNVYLPLAWKITLQRRSATELVPLSALIRNALLHTYPELNQFEVVLPERKNNGKYVICTNR